MEIETYRTMALLGLPLAREVSPELRAMEWELSEITQALRGAPESNDSHELLRRLSALLATSEALSNRTAFRFGAGRAYHALVKNRLDREMQLRKAAEQALTAGKPRLAAALTVAGTVVAAGLALFISQRWYTEGDYQD